MNAGGVLNTCKSSEALWKDSSDDFLCIDAHGNEGAASGNAGYEDSDYREGSYSNYGSSYDSERGDIENSGQRGGGTLQNAGRMIMTIIISALIFFVVLFLLRALLPVAVVIIAIVFIVRLIRG